jgi:hypothetical protein
MGTSNLKSTPITNLDSNPVLRNQAGNGAPGRVQKVSGFVTAVAADAVGSTYQFARLPSNARDIKTIMESEAQGAGKVSLSVYYSDSTTDGTQAANRGVVVPTTGAGFFTVDKDLTSAVAPTDVTGVGVSTSNGYTIDKRGKELWDALGLTSDPGGFFDLVGEVHTTAITTGTGRIRVTAEYIDT